MNTDSNLSPMNKTKQKNPVLKGVVGIKNMGNTCYCNTTIQLLRACPEWNAYILSQSFEDLKDKDTIYAKVLLAYQDILKPMWSAYQPAYIRPLGFISEIKKAVKGTVYESFGIPVPNDSHEYLVYLLDNFHEALKTIHDIPEQENNTSNMRIMGNNGWIAFYSKNKSVIVDIFFGMMRKTIECTNCNNKTYQWEVFNSLKIPCEGSTFVEWIKNECKESEIEGYDCEKCKSSKNKAIIKSHIWKLPQCLFVTLRRFNFDGNKCIISCPYNGEIVTFTEFFADESDDPSKHWKYELRGISDHHGSHIGGHYTAQFKHPITNEWWLFDDESSHKLESPMFNSSNYIYLFRYIT